MRLDEQGGGLTLTNDAGTGNVTIVVSRRFEFSLRARNKSG